MTEKVTGTVVSTTIPVTVSITHIDCTLITFGPWGVTINGGDTSWLDSGETFTVPVQTTLTVGPHLVQFTSPERVTTALELNGLDIDTVCPFTFSAVDFPTSNPAFSNENEAA